ncbi:hypothetical protein Z043_121659 [Scleropages formosus]|uniref:Chromosome 14 open reading frame 119 n=1 Tax=Scleropages formosus TaxID=113540 RepID=A0A0P7THJ5_SCLFO|nr:uncharacterized protein C14orf119 homolog [Scleropages formosus]KPP60349.1 hypothetical protein Z043_121659 [Scleropages formosus]
MSWFFKGFQGSSLQPPPSGAIPPAMDGPSAPTLTVTPQEVNSLARHEWCCPQTFSANENLADFPSPPCHTAPPNLGEMSCSSLGPEVPRDPMPLSYVTQQEQRCVLSWFLGWALPQRERFLQDLVSKAVPGKVCTLLEQLNTLQVRDRPPNIFECQLRLWSQWFESWSEEERNAFLHALEEKDPTFVSHFYRIVAGTAGRD